MDTPTIGYLAPVKSAVSLLARSKNMRTLARKRIIWRLKYTSFTIFISIECRFITAVASTDLVDGHGDGVVAELVLGVAEDAAEHVAEARHAVRAGVDEVVEARQPVDLVGGHVGAADGVDLVDVGAAGVAVLPPRLQGGRGQRQGQGEQEDEGDLHGYLVNLRLG